MRSLLNTVLNIIWLVLSGFWLFLAYLVFGVIACVFIITIPFGVACFRLAAFVLWPFGREVISDGRDTGVGTLANIIWFIVAGVWLALCHLGTALALAITIIGLPMAWANLKLIPATCFPFGKIVVPSEVAQQRRNGYYVGTGYGNPSRTFAGR